MNDDVTREVILVGAPWCGACKIMKDWFFAVPFETVRYCDVSELPDSGIMSLPTILFMENGEEVQRITGAMNKAELINRINSIFRI